VLVLQVAGHLFEGADKSRLLSLLLRQHAAVSLATASAPLPGPYPTPSPLSSFCCRVADHISHVCRGQGRIARGRRWTLLQASAGAVPASCRPQPALEVTACRQQQVHTALVLEPQHNMGACEVYLYSGLCCMRCNSSGTAKVIMLHQP